MKFVKWNKWIDEWDNQPKTSCHKKHLIVQCNWLDYVFDCWESKADCQKEKAVEPEGNILSKDCANQVDQIIEDFFISNDKIECFEKLIKAFDLFCRE